MISNLNCEHMITKIGCLGRGLKFSKKNKKVWGGGIHILLISVKVSLHLKQGLDCDYWGVSSIPWIYND